MWPSPSFFVAFSFVIKYWWARSEIKSWVDFLFFPRSLLLKIGRQPLCVNLSSSYSASQYSSVNVNYHNALFVCCEDRPRMVNKFMLRVPLDNNYWVNYIHDGEVSLWVSSVCWDTAVYGKNASYMYFLLQGAEASCLAFMSWENTFNAPDGRNAPLLAAEEMKHRSVILSIKRFDLFLINFLLYRDQAD